ncbi:Sensor histidine kinase YpdA [Clostridium sp. C105KSO15]|nr:Sensor histidine kinase YpdA [Clostridium sp. C105KSO15]
MRSRFQFKSIRSGMLICFLPIILSALLLIYGFSFRYTEKNVLNNSVNGTMQLIEQANHNIDSYLDYMENISYLMSGDKDLLRYLFSEKDPVRREELKSSVLERFRLVRETRDDIYNIGAVAGPNHILINDGTQTLNPYADILHEAWYRDALETDKGMTVLSSSRVQNIIMNEYPWVVTLSSSLRYPGRTKNQGVFFIDLNYKAIEEQCERIDLGARGYVFILDKKGNILYHPKQQLIYSGLKVEQIKEVLDCREEYFLSGKGMQQKLYTITISQKTGWTVVGVAYTAELLKNRSQTQLIYTLVTLLLCLVLTAAVTILSRRITKPMILLQNSMKRVERGKFEQVDLTRIPDHEIRTLGNAFNMMADEIQKLMAENIREQEEKRRNEMKALQSQINPHFLYNTLDSIVWMAEAGKNREVVHMTMALARLLRRSISSDQELFTIRQETDYVKNYLDIQQMRYKDKLDYEMAIDEAILEKPVIRLVLQPLAENAIYHGIKYKSGRGLIRIEAYPEGKDIILKVTDNGKGMTEEQMKSIFQKHKVNYERNGVGVYNVQTRLKLYYGREYGLCYESSPDGGTAAIVRIPDMEGGGEGDKEHSH